MADVHAVLQLRAAGTSLMLDASGPGLPSVMHWGPDLGDLSDDDAAAAVLALTPAVPPSAFDEPVRVGLLPEGSLGWLGRPGLSGSRDRRDFSPRFEPVSISPVADASGGRTGVTVTARDVSAGLALVSELVLEPSGVLRLRHVLTNAGDDDYEVHHLDVSLPLPDRVVEVLDLAGRWSKERQPQRMPLPVGTWVRDSRQGRPGHDFAVAVVALTAGTGFRSGEAWSVSPAWSGDHRTAVERRPDGRVTVRSGELLAPGEVVLGPGESYATPWVVCAYSADGLDGAASAYHAWLRARPTHPTRRRPRPVTLNTWEAVYFDHDLDRLKALADVAAEVGVERFVLDDGWFTGRTDDHRALGDWVVDPVRWPDGLHPLVDHVRGLGMEFGLWVEPEMVNVDSDLARAHPDWVLHVGDRLPPEWRHQQVLDLSSPAAYEHIRDALDSLLDTYAIAYLKWDHNRVLVDAAHDGRPAVHTQTLAVYRLLDELRERHPDLEIESCASGGARIDLGILERTDRVWASDTNDALERQLIQRWTGQVLPPELVGSHIGPPLSHTTGRVLDLGFRAATALFAHAGIEWDITTASDLERQLLRGFIRLYKEHRDLLHAGTVVRADHPDPAAYVHGVVAADRSEALFAYVQLQTSDPSLPAVVRLPGLDPDRRYRVTTPMPAGAPWLLQTRAAPWLADGVTLPGSVLAAAGLAMPPLFPGHALLLHLRPA